MDHHDWLRLDMMVAWSGIVAGRWKETGGFEIYSVETRREKRIVYGP